MVTTPQKILAESWEFFQADILVRVISEIFPSNRKLTFRQRQVEINFLVTDTDKLLTIFSKNLRIFESKRISEFSTWNTTYVTIGISNL